MAEKKKTTKKTGTKKSPSKKKKNQGFPVDSSEIIRWLVAFLAFFLILTFFIDKDLDSGTAGVFLSETLRGLFGAMYYVVPFLLILMVVFWNRDRENGVVGAKYIVYALLFMFLSILLHVIVSGGEDIAFDRLYAKGVRLNSAGLIGGSVAMLFTSTIGPIASVVLAVVGIFICVALLCGTTPADTIAFFVDWVRDVIDNIRTAKEERAALYEDEDDYEEEEEEEEPAPPVVPKKAPVKKSAPEKKKKKLSVVPAIPADELPNDPMAEPELPDDPNRGFDNNRFEVISETDIASEFNNNQPVAEELPFEPDPAPVSQISALDKALDALEVMEAMEGANVAPVAEEAVSQEKAPNEPILSTSEEELSLDPIENAPYVFPPISLLTANAGGSTRPSPLDIDRTSRKLEEVLASFNVKARVIDSTFGPTVTRYELQPETGVRVKSIANLADDLALHLAATAIRIENIPGKAAVGIEIPNKSTATVRLRGLIDNPIFRDNKSRLFTALGEDVAGNPVYLDIGKMPHLLVAGATGQGKSVCINSLIISLLYRNHPDDVKLILIDPKQVEFSDFKDIPHLLVPVINDPKNAAGTLNWACTEMENRYRLIQEVGARDLAGYNMAVSDDPERPTLPQIVIFIDEFADLMMTAPDDVETSVCRLAQKARAAGMHLVIGTQRPSVDVITGLIKANIPSRIALTTTSQVDSRTILDQTGAEKLLGKGDMLYYPVGAMKPIRVQGAFVDGKSEVAAVTQFIKEAAQAQYDETIMKQIENEAKLCGMKGKKGVAEPEPDDGSEKLDPMFMDAIEVAVDSGTVSTSLLQRRLSLGYARAARIIDKMERRGYISPFDAATKKRNILITREQFAELKMNGLNGEKKKEEEVNE